MKSFNYYLGNYLFDYTMFLLPSTAFIILLPIMQISVFEGQAGAIFSVILCFGLSLISLTYLVSFLFSNSNTAFRSIGILYILIGYFLPLTATSVLTIKGIPESIPIIFASLFYLDPFYPFYSTLIYLALVNDFGDDPDLIKSFFPGFIPYPYLGCPAMVITGFVFFGLAVLIDSKKLNNFKK